jgi:serine/threonine-protein kinase RIO1
MVDTVKDVLLGGYALYKELKSIHNDIIANRESVQYVLSRLEGVADKVHELATSGSPTDRELAPARNFEALVRDISAFVQQFTKHDRKTGKVRKLLTWSTKAYNRKEDQGALEDFLTRLDRCSRDLNLKITFDIKSDVKDIAEMLQLDGVQMHDMIVAMQKEVLAQGDQLKEDLFDKFDTQFNLVNDCLRELRAQKTGPSAVASSGSLIDQLVAFDQQYQFVCTKEPHDDVDDDDKDEAELGAGAFGEVYLIRGKIITDERFAVKLLRLKKVENAGVDPITMRMEACNLRRLTHVNIIRMWGECQYKKGKWYGIIMEYAAGGSVQAYIDSANNKPVLHTKQWLQELCEGLSHMHQEARMQHRDLKPHNLMLSSRLVLKIADLGLACAHETAQSLSKKGTQLYMY